MFPDQFAYERQHHVHVSGQIGAQRLPCSARHQLNGGAGDARKLRPVWIPFLELCLLALPLCVRVSPLITTLSNLKSRHSK